MILVLHFTAKEALESATHADNLGRRLLKVMKECVGILSIGATGSTFFAAFGIVLHTFTPVLMIAGYMF